MRTLLLYTFAALLTGAPDPTSQPLVDTHVGCLLGGSAGGKWLQAADIAEKLSGGERYRVVTLSGQTEAATGQKPESAGAACAGTLDVELKPAPGEDSRAIAVGGSWSPVPRAVQNISGSRQQYGKLLQAASNKLGVRTTPVVQQVLKADLDGDGKDEVIAVIRNFSYDVPGKPVPSAAYSGVLVRRVMDEKVETLTAEFDKAPRSGGVSEHTIGAIADLNGDGVMEIVISGRYRKGVFTAVYALEDGKLRKVLSCACGG